MSAVGYVFGGKKFLGLLLLMAKCVSNYFFHTPDFV